MRCRQELVRPTWASATRAYATSRQGQHVIVLSAQKYALCFARGGTARHSKLFQGSSILKLYRLPQAHERRAKVFRRIGLGTTGSTDSPRGTRQALENKAKYALQGCPQAPTGNLLGHQPFDPRASPGPQGGGEGGAWAPLGPWASLSGALGRTPGRLCPGTPCVAQLNHRVGAPRCLRGAQAQRGHPSRNSTWCLA